MDCEDKNQRRNRWERKRSYKNKRKSKAMAKKAHITDLMLADLEADETLYGKEEKQGDKA